MQHLIQRFSTYFLNLMTDIFFNTQNIPSKPFLGHISLSGPTSAPPPSLLRSTFSVFLSSHFWINFRCARGQALLSSNHLQPLQFVTQFSTPSLHLSHQIISATLFGFLLLTLAACLTVLLLHYVPTPASKPLL